MDPYLFSNDDEYHMFFIDRQFFDIKTAFDPFDIPVYDCAVFKFNTKCLNKLNFNNKKNIILRNLRPTRAGLSIKNGQFDTSTMLYYLGRFGLIRIIEHYISTYKMSVDKWKKILAGVCRSSVKTKKETALVLLKYCIAELRKLLPDDKFAHVLRIALKKTSEGYARCSSDNCIHTVIHGILLAHIKTLNVLGAFIDSSVRLSRNSACCYGHMPVVKMLISNIKKQNVDALPYACSCKNTKVTGELIDILFHSSDLPQKINSQMTKNIFISLKINALKYGNLKAVSKIDELAKENSESLFKAINENHINGSCCIIMSGNLEIIKLYKDKLEKQSEFMGEGSLSQPDNINQWQDLIETLHGTIVGDQGPNNAQDPQFTNNGINLADTQVLESVIPNFMSAVTSNTSAKTHIINSIAELFNTLYPKNNQSAIADKIVSGGVAGGDSGVTIGYSYSEPENKPSVYKYTLNDSGIVCSNPVQIAKKIIKNKWNVQFYTKPVCRMIGLADSFDGILINNDKFTVKIKHFPCRNMLFILSSVCTVDTLKYLICGNIKGVFNCSVIIPKK